RGLRWVGSVRSATKARQVRAAAREADVDVETVLLDVTDAAACRRVVERLKPWGLVNNAGSSLSGAIEDVGDAEAREALDTMVLAPMRYVPGTRLYGAVAGEAGIDLQGV